MGDAILNKKKPSREQEGGGSSENRKLVGSDAGLLGTEATNDRLFVPEGQTATGTLISSLAATNDRLFVP